jgi:hypothetical protein
LAEVAAGAAGAGHDDIRFAAAGEFENEGAGKIHGG